MQVEITNRPELRIAAVQHVGAYDRISEAFGRLGAITAQAGLFGPMVAVYHDDPKKTPAEKLRSDAGITIQPTAKVPAGLKELKIPGGRYARTTYKGPYEALPEVWSQLMGEWLPKSGHRFGDGSSYELYRNDPTNTKPADLLTDLYIPLG
jgi:AraC family transcriptional regulator